MRSFGESIPGELFDAASSDGTWRSQRPRSIALPLAAPGLGVTSIHSDCRMVEFFVFSFLEGQRHTVRGSTYGTIEE